MRWIMDRAMAQEFESLRARYPLSLGRVAGRPGASPAKTPDPSPFGSWPKVMLARSGEMLERPPLP